MGKVVTIYLSDEETYSLKDFCDENQCTQYSALKTAVRQLLHRPLISYEEDDPETITELLQEENQETSELVEDAKIHEDHIEESDIVAKIRSPKTGEEKQQSEPESALKRLLRASQKRREEQERTDSGI